MNMELGKIEAIRFGFGGYQDAQFGVSITLSGKSWGVQDFRGYWSEKPKSNYKWTEEQQNQAWLDMLWDIRKWLAASEGRFTRQAQGQAHRSDIREQLTKELAHLD